MCSRPHCSSQSPQLQHNKEARCIARCQDPVLVHTYLLFPPLLPLVLCVLQHLLSPKVKEVGWIGVELQTLLPIVPADVRNQEVALDFGWHAGEVVFFLL